MSGSLLVASVLILLSMISVNCLEKCEDIGFNNELECSSCDKLEEFVGDDKELIWECRRCCSPAVKFNGKHDFAILETCKCGSAGYDEIQKYIDYKGINVPNLTIKYTPGQAGKIPELTLMGSDGLERETIQIGDPIWNARRLSAFIHEQLK